MTATVDTSRVSDGVEIFFVRDAMHALTHMRTIVGVRMRGISAGVDYEVVIAGTRAARFFVGLAEPASDLVVWFPIPYYVREDTPVQVWELSYAPPSWWARAGEAIGAWWARVWGLS